MNRKIYLIVEFSSFFVFLPLALFFLQVSLNQLIIPILLIFAFICFFILIKDNSFDRKRLIKLRGKKIVKNLLIRWLFGLVLLPLFTYTLDDSLLFYLPQNNFILWLAVIFFYPLFSVYPQELIFRSFFFHRYSRIFKSQQTVVLVSGLTFGLAHLVFQNLLAPVLSTVGGIMFARTYSKSKSLMLSVIEHGIWGDLIFTVGLGVYFYSGSNF